MNDLERSKKSVLQDGLSVCVTGQGHIIYSSKDSGIKPMYIAYTEGFDFSGLCGTDKVVGLGAAYFWHAMHIGHLHAGIISEPALDYLIDHEINVTYNNLVPRIKSREGNGFCPVETLAAKNDSFEAFLKETKKFLKQINQI